MIFSIRNVYEEAILILKLSQTMFVCLSYESVAMFHVADLN